MVTYTILIKNTRYVDITVIQSWGWDMPRIGNVGKKLSGNQSCIQLAQLYKEKFLQKLLES